MGMRGDHDGRAQEGRGRVDLAPQYDRNAAGQEVADHPATDAA